MSHSVDLQSPLLFKPYHPPSPLTPAALATTESEVPMDHSPPQRDASYGKARKAKYKDGKPSKHLSCSACRAKKTKCDRRENCGSKYESDLSNASVWDGALPAFYRQPTKVLDDFPEASTAAQREIARLRALVARLATRSVHLPAFPSPSSQLTVQRTRHSLGIDPLDPTLSEPSSPLPEPGVSPPSSLDSPVASNISLSVAGSRTPAKPFPPHRIELPTFNEYRTLYVEQEFDGSGRFSLADREAEEFSGAHESWPGDDDAPLFYGVPTTPDEEREIFEMGMVSTFCIVSGGSPIACDALRDVYENELDRFGNEVEGKDGELLEPKKLLVALEELAGDSTEDARDEREGQGDLTIVGQLIDPHITCKSSLDTNPTTGPIPENLGEPGVTDPDQFGSIKEVLALDSSRIRRVPRCKAAEWFDFGSVSSHDDKQMFLVSYGTVVMFQSSAIEILRQATNGRLTPERVWRLTMRQRDTKEMNYVLDGLDYGEISDAIEQFLSPVPGLEGGGILRLEKTEGGVEGIKRAIIHEGRWWVWMRPDRFPIKAASFHPDPPSLTESVDSSSTPSGQHGLASLPADVLLVIASLLPVSSILMLASACRNIRARILLRQGNDVARAWLNSQGKYWLPPAEGDAPEGGWWIFLRRCVESGSMKNRRRIWGVVERLEVMVDESEAEEAKL
ncbi:hypothetical protein P7C70_g4154, partial [Phenoliferia sp. Uapishka_3]